MDAPNRRYATGMEVLDRRLDGGLPVGSLVAFTAPAWSQSELLLAQLAREQPVLLVSVTGAPPDEVRARFDVLGRPPVGVSVVSTRPGALLDDTGDVLDRVDPGSYVVLDPVDGLEAGDREAYATFLNDLKSRLRETESVGVLHGLETDGSPPARGLTQKRADFCWRLRVDDAGREIKARLLVTKARGHRALTEPLPLVLTDQVRIDTSRMIV
ncbi:MAG: RAD55 family ATPase [Halobacteriaceae archaeon]